MEQLLVGKLGREDVENGRLGGIEAVRDELRSRDEKVELGKIAHRLARRELIE